MRPPTPVHIRLLRKVEIQPDGCWIYTGKLTKGYVRTNVGSSTDGTHRLQFGHRILYERYRGPIPVGLTLDHLCRKPACIRPAHMEAVSIQENLRRGTAPPQALARRTCCPRCGGAFERHPAYNRGHRFCRRCYNDRNNGYRRNRRARRRAERKAA